MISKFLATYDEFRSLEESKVSAALTQAQAYCSTCWGELREQGVFLVAAHILTTRWLQVGTVASFAVVQAKGSQANNPMIADKWFTTTTYGQQYLELRQAIPVTGWVT